MILLQEYVTNMYEYKYTVILSFLSIFFAISVIIAKNPIYSVLFLIGLFLTISIYLMVLDMYFLGLSYILVYVGAISILFLFILMLINIRISELLTEGRNSIPLALTIIIIINVSVESVIPYSTYIINVFSTILASLTKYFFSIFTNGDIMLSSAVYKQYLDYRTANINSNIWDGNLIDNTHITSIGNILYSNLFIFIIIISLILLLAMVGSIIITLKK